jgi:RNA polymerase sigma-70 factor (ECF subfamily)
VSPIGSIRQVLGRRAQPDAAREERALVQRLRAGDEQAFLALVARHNAMMLRFATSLVGDPTVAEEVVQDTWLGVLRGIDRFEGRSALRTWILRILVNRAKSTGAIERRSVPVGDGGPAVDAQRFDGGGHWMAPPQHWIEDSDDRLEAQALSGVIQAAIDALPPRQRDVLLLRDVSGLSSEEVCAVLDLEDGNQRVLLHRARSRLRQALQGRLEAA